MEVINFVMEIQVILLCYLHDTLGSFKITIDNITCLLQLFLFSFHFSLISFYKMQICLRGKTNKHMAGIFQVGCMKNTTNKCLRSQRRIHLGLGVGIRTTNPNLYSGPSIKKEAKTLRVVHNWQFECTTFQYLGL